MMLADVGIAVMMKLVTNDASFSSGRPRRFMQPAHNDESDTRGTEELILYAYYSAAEAQTDRG